MSANTASKTFTALTNGRTYKIVVAFHNRYGYSAWSTLAAAKPGAVPSAGGSPRYLVWQHGAYIHYGWNRSLDNGSVVTHYEVASRCQNPSSSWGAWVNHMMPNTKDVYFNFLHLGSSKTCQVKVHAKNGFGWGAWSSPRTVRR